ncbi:MAG: hypothetical protein ACP5NZ_00825 [Nanobdellota archaeon]
MSAKSLGDIETGESINDPYYVALTCPEGEEVFLNKSTFKKRALDKLINCNLAKSLKEKVYAVYLKSRERKRKPRLRGYVTEDTVINQFPNAYLWFNGKVPLSVYFPIKSIKTLATIALI